MKRSYPYSGCKESHRMPARLHRTLAFHTHHTHERNKMNPFELRFATFTQAKELLENNYKASMAAWDLMDKTAKQLSEAAPQFPTMEQIIDAAMQINKFVSESTEKELTKAVKKLTGF